MVAGSITQALVSPVSPDRLWNASFDTRKLIPKLIPNQVASIVLLEGDGGVGSVTQFNFGEAFKDLKYVKNWVIAVDNENYVFKFSLVEGGVGTKLKSCIIESKMDATSEGGSKMTLKMDYDTLRCSSITASLITEGASDHMQRDVGQLNSILPSPQAIVSIANDDLDILAHKKEALVSPVSPDRLFKASFNTQNLISKLIPDQVASIALLEGYGEVSSVTQFNFSEALKDLKYVKNLVIAIDNENYVFQFSLVEGGGVGTKLKSCIIESKMEATSERGSKKTLKIDYDTLDKAPLSQEEAKSVVEGALLQTKAIEGHLQANPDAYA